MNTEAMRIIEALGGTSKAASICEVDDSAVSQWRHSGIPRARLLFLKAAYPKLFNGKRPHRREK